MISESKNEILKIAAGDRRNIRQLPAAFLTGPVQLISLSVPAWCLSVPLPPGRSWIQRRL